MLRVLIQAKGLQHRLHLPSCSPSVHFSTEKKSGGKKKPESKDENKLETESLLKFYNTAEQAKW